MKKGFNSILKRTAVCAMALSMLAPSASILTVDTYADSASLIKEYDFEKGFREFYDTDAAYKIISAGGQFIKKTPEQQEEGDRVDANGFVIMGEDANIRYYTQSPGNQPSTKYDSDKGTVFFLAGTYDVPELVKELPANIAGDEAGSQLLDSTYKVGTIVRKASTFKSAMTFTNPFRKLESDSAVLALWAKIPADATEDKVGLVEFSDGKTSVSFCYDKSVAALSETDKWHYITYVVNKDAVTAYVDGEKSTLNAVIDGTAPENMITFLKTANIYYGATNTSSVRTVEETVFDDVAFYNGSMNDEDVKALYNEAFDEYNKTATISEPLAFIALDSEKDFENINAENPSTVEKFNINGHEVNGVAVVENVKGAEKNGIKIDNPLSGLKIGGATIGYWIQVEPKAKVIEKETINNPDKGYTGQYPNELVINETVTLAFMDTTKTIYNPKHGTSADGFSYFYTKNRMQAYFEEGSYYGMNTGNQFEADSSEEDGLSYTDESRNWHYMTLVINNDGATIYCDGKVISGLYEMRAPRFLDGYYRRVAERKKISTLYGTFGGSGNQLTTLITSFLTYEDTDIYFGWLPTSDFRNETTSPMNVARLSIYDSSMSADKVAELYEYEMSSVLALPEYAEGPTDQPTDEPLYVKGDLNNDGVVDAKDALTVLRMAAKIEEIKEDSVVIGDMDDNGYLDASDALSILKIAAKLL